MKDYRVKVELEKADYTLVRRRWSTIATTPYLWVADKIAEVVKTELPWVVDTRIYQGKERIR